MFARLSVRYFRFNLHLRKIRSFCSKGSKNYNESDRTTTVVRVVSISLTVMFLGPFLIFYSKNFDSVYDSSLEENRLRCALSEKEVIAYRQECQNHLAKGVGRYDSGFTEIQERYYAVAMKRIESATSEEVAALEKKANWETERFMRRRIFKNDRHHLRHYFFHLYNDEEIEFIAKSPACQRRIKAGKPPTSAEVKSLAYQELQDGD